MNEKQTITIDVEKYFSQAEIKEIAEQELRNAFRRQFRTEADVERVLTNLTHEYIFSLVAEQWDGDFAELLKAKIKKAIEENVSFYVFRRKDSWGAAESPAVAILDEECKNSRPLIRECVERHVREYPFHELNREEIGDTIWNVIMEKILPAKKDAEAASNA